MSKIYVQTNERRISMVNEKRVIESNSDKDVSSSTSFADKEKSINELQKAVELIPTKEFNTSEEFMKWLDEYKS